MSTFLASSCMHKKKKILYNTFNLHIYIYKRKSCYTIYKSKTAEPIWLKIGGEVAYTRRRT